MGRGSRPLHAVPAPVLGSRESGDQRGRVEAMGGSTAAAAAIEPKTQPFADERTGAQRRPLGAWARGDGEGAKILPLRPEPEDLGQLPRSGVAPTEPAGAASEPGAASAGLPEQPTEAIVERPSQGAAESGIRTSPAPARPGTASGEYRRPPVLASESLRADIAPNLPGLRKIRVAAVGLGSGGAAAVLAVAGLTPVSVTIAVALALLAVLGLARLDYRQRAAGLLAVALPGVCATSLLGASDQSIPDGTLLALAVSGLAGALYFRAEYRASRLARGLVAAGVLLGAIWLGVSGALPHLANVDAVWQSWLPALLGASLAVILGLALLGFMTQNSTGGCAAWATTLLLWLAAYEAAEHTAALFPSSGAAPSGAGRLAVAMGAVATPLLAALTAMAIAQLLVVASGGGREDRPA